MNFFEEITMKHCFRECNKVADHLANFGLNCNDITWFDNFHQLPREVRGEVNMDKLQFPSLRSKTMKKNLFLNRQLLMMYHFDVP